ncbi:YgfZ/GcvT domain-containing protein [Alcaligenes faecalis]|uniref:CAF17-like 4Fe-4S cluster assembly/insertion protein YgfZ n=1 Tax=Alcaligenes faecalis TaxID=511 RepID=UPI001D170229|nr:folate-binding protein [Alcaligenes faecalis]
MPAPSSFALPDLCVLQFQGADAVSFLHAQVSNDLEHLAADRACIAAYCTAKGRSLATMVLWREQDETVFALVRRDLSEALIKRLRMFVLRSKVTISLAELQVYGVADQSAAQAVWNLQREGDDTLIQAPGDLDGLNRHWRISPQQDTNAQASEGRWETADILAGLPWISADTQDLFIPQTLNLDLIDGINFKKGCYPGQEVVARSHYRGTIKRRMMAARTAVLDTAVQVQEAADVVLVSQNAEPVAAARIINRAWQAEQQRLYVLMEVVLADLEQGQFQLEQGQALELQPLPYALPELSSSDGTN